MHTPVLLLDEGTALALVGVIAIVAVCILSLALVALVFFFHAQRDATPRAGRVPAASTRSVPVELPRAGLGLRRSAMASIRNVEIDVPTRHADAIIDALQASGWFVRDTGDVVATDEDEEGLTTISVDVPSDLPRSLRASSGEEIQ